MIGMMVFFLVLFAISEWLHLPLLSDPSPWLKKAGPLAMAVGVGLLILDVLLPVPSSVVMLAHGLLFGPWIGAGLSLIGCMGAASFGFALGRRGGPLLQKWVSAEERRQADALLLKWGALAILVTRPLPLLAESTAIIAGSSPMTWRQMLVASFLGSLPACVLYAWAGATSGTLTSGLGTFAAVLGLAALFWWVGKRAAKTL